MRGIPLCPQLKSAKLRLTVFILLFFIFLAIQLNAISKKHLDPTANWSPWVINDIAEIKDNADRWRRKPVELSFRLDDIYKVDQNNFLVRLRPRIIRSKDGFFERQSGGRVSLNKGDGFIFLALDDVDEASCHRMAMFFITEGETRKRLNKEWYFAFKVNNRVIKLSDAISEKNSLTQAGMEAASVICEPAQKDKMMRIEWIGL